MADLDITDRNVICGLFDVLQAFSKRLWGETFVVELHDFNGNHVGLLPSELRVQWLPAESSRRSVETQESPNTPHQREPSLDATPTELGLSAPHSAIPCNQ